MSASKTTPCLSKGTLVSTRCISAAPLPAKSREKRCLLSPSRHSTADVCSCPSRTMIRGRRKLSRRCCCWRGTKKSKTRTSSARSDPPENLRYLGICERTRLISGNFFFVLRWFEHSQVYHPDKE